MRPVPLSFSASRLVTDMLMHADVPAGPHPLSVLQVREHHRKLRKEQKDKVKKGGGTLEYRKKKDPGVPNSWCVRACKLASVRACTCW